MKRCSEIFLIISLLLAAACLSVSAQVKKDVPKFDPAHQVTFKGVVDQVQDYECPISGTLGTHLTVKSMTETVEVHLAPAKFLKDYGVVISKGDAVQITGTRTTFDGKPAMLARSIIVGNYTYSFRDDRGLPLW